MPQPTQQKTCNYCDGPFRARRIDQQYCSNRCRYNGWKERQSAPPSDQRLSDLVSLLIEAHSLGDVEKISAARVALDAWRPPTMAAKPITKM